jgi:hypothetical protein
MVGVRILVKELSDCRYNGGRCERRGLCPQTERNYFSHGGRADLETVASRVNVTATVTLRALSRGCDVDMPIGI